MAGEKKKQAQLSKSTYIQENAWLMINGNGRVSLSLTLDQWITSEVTGVWKENG